jgi:hypothetical protein
VNGGFLLASSPMRSSLLLTGALLAAAGSSLAACGGSATDGIDTGTQGGAAGSSGSSGQSGTAGSAGASAGSGQAGAGAGGAGAAGASAGAAGGAGAAGVGGAAAGSGGAGQAGAGSCAGPSDPTRSSVCVTLAPEAITLRPDDPQLDGKGVLYLAAYDTPQPDGQNGSPDAVPVGIAIYPPDGQSLVSVNELPTVRLDNLPPKIHLRALFFDNAEALANKEISWGVWLGNLDLSTGFTNDPKQLPGLDLAPGAGVPVSIPLLALRRFDVTVSVGAGVKPLDDAQGPLAWITTRQSTIIDNLPFFGVSPTTCTKLGAGTAVVSGFVAGPGDHYVLAHLDDFGQKAYDPGTLTNLTVVGDAYAIPEVNRVTVGATDYRASHDLALSAVIPVPAGQPVPLPYPCP